MDMRNFNPWPLTKCAATHWVTDQAPTTGAALAFYTAFSLAPLLVISVTVIGWIVGAEVAYAQVGQQLTDLFGKATATTLLEAMRNSGESEGTIATVISIVSLIIGATTIFTVLETALEQIWGASDVPQGLRGWLRARAISLGLVLAIDFLLLVSLFVSTALLALRKVIAARFDELVGIAVALDFVVTTAFITGLIALIYRYLPAKRLDWRSILWGALITALLFQLGRWLIGLYLGRSTQPSAFGAAASFAAMLLWLYYSAQIFLFGAEFTACLAGKRREAGAAKKSSGSSTTKLRSGA